MLNITKILSYIIISFCLCLMNCTDKEEMTQPENKSLDAPSDLIIHILNDSQVQLNWTDNSTFEEGFEIERKISDAVYRSIQKVPANVDSFIDIHDFVLDAEYKYRVRAFTSDDSSAYIVSNAIMISLDVPSNVILENNGISSVKLSWTDNSDIETGFEIECQMGSNDFETVETVAANTNNFIDEYNPLDNSPITYRIRAVSNKHKSDFIVSNSLKYKIIFQSRRDGNYEIYSMNLDGTDQTNLTNTLENEFSPFNFSDDGMQIIYTRGHGDAKFMMDYTGLNQVNLNLNETGTSSLVDWIDNSNRFLYSLSVSTGDNGRIFLMDKEILNKIQIFEIPNTITLLEASPGNLNFIYGTYDDIFVLNIDGSNNVNISSTSSTAWEYAAAWSHRGDKIAYRSLIQSTGKGNICIINPDGSEKQELIANIENPGNFIYWSPDGSKLLYDANSSLYVTYITGTNSNKIVDLDLYPSYSLTPDGQQIVYKLSYNDDGEIFIMNIDGTNIRQLTHNSDSDSYPVVSPIPLK